MKGDAVSHVVNGVAKYVTYLVCLFVCFVFVYQHTAQPSLKRAVSVKGGDGGYEKRERQAGSGTQPSETEL